MFQPEKSTEGEKRVGTWLVTETDEATTYTNTAAVPKDLIYEGEAVTVVPGETFTVRKKE